MLGDNGRIANFGSFIQIQAADILLENCVFDGINFSYSNLIETNFIIISSFQERNISMTVKDTTFTNISLTKTNLIRGRAESVTLLFKGCLFANIEWQNRLFDITISPINLSFVDTVFNFLRISDLSSELTAIAIMLLDITLSFQRTTIILGTLNAATFIQYTQGSGGNISFVESRILSFQSYNTISNNQTSNQSKTPAKLLQESSTVYSESSLMKFLLIQGNCNVSFNDSLINYQGATTPPPVFVTTSDFSLKIHNTAFRNMIVVPDIISSRAIYSDYFDTYGRYLGGVINVVIRPPILDSSEKTISITVNGSSFEDINFSSTGALSILNQHPTALFSMAIANSSFENLRSKYGPMMTLLLPYNAKPFRTAGNLSIINSTIVSTTAELLGGAIFNNMSGNISITQSTSSNNKMNTADNLLYDTTETSPNWESTQPNQSQIIGTPKFLNYTISDKDPNSGINASKCPDSNVLCVSNASSYSLASILINVTILDSSSRIFSDPSQTAAVTLTCLAKNYSLPCFGGFCQINNTGFVLSGKENDTIEMNFSYTSEYASLTNMTRITLRKCLPGEYYVNSSGTCEYCSNGTYSLDPNSSCKPCPPSAICQGGSHIAPLEGYWRENTSTDIIYKCNEERC